METAGGSAFVFITTDPRNELNQEAIKVHVLRQRGQDRRPGHRGLPAPSLLDHPGGEFHIWNSATKGRNPRRTKTATIPRNRDEAVPAPASVQIDEVDVPGSALELTASTEEPPASPETAGCDVVIVPTLSSGGSDGLLAHYYVLSGGGSEIPRKLLRSYQTSIASFTAFLAVSSSRYGDERGVRSRVDAQEKEVEALQEVARQIALSPAAPSPGTMLAVALLANLQELRNEPGLAELHWTGLKCMVDLNGGVRRLETDEEMHTYFFWLDALVCNAAVTPLGRMSPDDPVTRPRPPEPLLELTSLLERISTSHLAARSREISRAGADESITRVLHRCGLSRDPYTMMKSFRAKLACLLYFSCLKLQYKISLRDIAVYQAIAQKVKDRERRYSVQPEELYYIVLASSQQEGLRYLVYSVSRLLYASKNLERTDCQVNARLLSAFTGHPDPFDDSNEILSDWQDLMSNTFQ